MSDTTGPASDTAHLGTLLDGNQKTTKSLYIDSPAIFTKKRQRIELGDLAVEDSIDRAIAERRFRLEYVDVQELPSALAAKQPAPPKSRRSKAHPNAEKALVRKPAAQKLLESSSGEVAVPNNRQVATIENGSQRPSSDSSSLTRPDASTPHGNGPEWHPPWKLMRVISGHLGWVRSLAVEPGNKWFASGAGDRTIKIWDLATGSLRLTLTGHISTVRGLAVSPRHPYLFSCGEDNMIKCWDLETNKVIRHYHGHLSGVYTLALHPTLDVLVTGGRDGVARVWDMRTRSNIHVLSGHTGTVSDVKCQEADPQVITGSLDATVRLWDLAAGKTMGVLTHHKKGVRALATHPQEFTFASGSTGSIKQWKCPEGAFMQNFDGHNAIINTLSVNQENVLFSGGDNGSMSFWDWKTGHRFQALNTTAHPGSLDAEAGIMSSTFDRSGLRLICGEADKTIKIWKQDEKATPESHPVNWQPTLARRKY
ncbi:Pre-mRNA-splicing factor prp46 [Colletotrichum shisoi]|uniref:Pre-mRNA-splicing factor PRP46 n=1 Tax=Colletotrichum shisoi TaxID=2078593 RepID=A0A5Q4BH44_9PEZI|nr:Pre-mRNA-splicing factor prp46 [Colletotrichum shisoi]